MKKKILIGSILAVALLTLVSFSSVVGYSSVKSDLDTSVGENTKEVVYQEESTEEDCGCKDDSRLDENFTSVCYALLGIWCVLGVCNHFSPHH